MDWKTYSKQVADVMGTLNDDESRLISFFESDLYNKFFKENSYCKWCIKNFEIHKNEK